MYTALIGGYETLQEQPLAALSSVPFVCFTDDASVTSETWQIVRVAPSFELDPVRSSRRLKLLGHPDINDAKQIIWVDNRVVLKRDPLELADAFLTGHDVAFFEHSFRNRLSDEFDAIVRSGYDDPSRVYEQLIHYAEIDPDVLDDKPLWTGLFLRRNNASTAAFLMQWYEHVLRYSRRDQLSINAALRRSRVNARRIRLDNQDSVWHSWPPIGPQLGRNESRPASAYQYSIRAPLLKLREQTRRAEEADKAKAELRREIVRLKSNLAKARKRAKTLSSSNRAPVEPGVAASEAHSGTAAHQAETT